MMATEKKISEIPENNSRETKVLEELKYLAKSRNEEVRATYDNIPSGELEKRKLEAAERGKKRQKDFHYQVPRFMQLESSGKAKQATRKTKTHQDGNDTDSQLCLSSDHCFVLPGDKQSSDTIPFITDSGKLTQDVDSRMLPQDVSGMVPLGIIDTPSPSLFEGYGFSANKLLPFDYDNQRRGSCPEFTRDMLSPTRPNKLDGLHKTTDLLDETDTSSYRLRTRHVSASPSIVNEMQWPELYKYSEVTDERSAKRDGLPRPPQEKTTMNKSPGKGDRILRPPSQDKKANDGSPRKDKSFENDGHGWPIQDHDKATNLDCSTRPDMPAILEYTRVKDTGPQGLLDLDREFSKEREVF